MKIAIVGAGIYGVLTAIELSKVKSFSIDLFDEKGLLAGASSINQFRIHRGYHYPRSQETLNQIANATEEFNQLFSSSIVKPKSSLYAISKTDSKTTPNEFENFCTLNKLPFKESRPDWINFNAISHAYQVDESLYNPVAIASQLTGSLQKTRVNFYMSDFPKQTSNVMIW